jgi:NAD(P)-dependent dehydrogenase (short-subunit alcohol dehydrogenase family)
MTTSTTSGFTGKTLLILGGSSGIGLAAARLAAEHGASVALVARHVGRLTKAADVVRAAGPAQRAGTISTHLADVTDADALAGAIADATRVHGGIDHVLIAAGTATLAPLLDDRAIEMQVAPLEQRVRSAVATVRAIAPTMRAGGSFVLIGGISTDRPVKGAWATVVGTAATEQLARALALEIAPLRANAISPGWIDTPMWDGVLGEHKHGVFESVVARTPIGRFPTAEEVGSAALFLMQNQGITGEILHIDGGQRLT